MEAPSREVSTGRILVAAIYEPLIRPLDARAVCSDGRDFAWRDLLRAEVPAEASPGPGNGNEALPTTLGWYDARDAAVRREQESLAARHGIDAFCFVWRRPRQSDGPGALFDGVLQAAGPSFPFLLLLREMADAPTSATLVRAWAAPIAHIVEDRRYLCRDGKPLILIDGGLSGLDELRAELATHLEVELLVVSSQAQRGAPSDWRGPAADDETPCVPCVTVRVGAGSDPMAAYRDELRNAVASAGRAGLVLVESWNRWADDARLEPDSAAGTERLLATASSVRPPAPWATAVRDVLLENERQFELMVQRAKRWYADGELEAALQLAAASCDWACHQTGRLGSEDLEILVGDIGRAILEREAHWQSTSGEAERRRVVHVLTRAARTGGHSRLAWRWMEMDHASEHVVVLTDQGDEAIPEELLAAAAVLRLTQPTRIQRVRELAGLLASGDLAVLHVHPYDAVAIAACADATKRPPTILVNHADHLFWLGASAADLVVNLRPSGVRLTVEERGISPTHCSLLPSPVPAPPMDLSREIARQPNRPRSDAPTMVTMASVYKYNPVGGIGLADLVDRVLERVPAAHLVAIGPAPDSGPWERVVAHFPERVRLLGVIDDPAPILASADLYLDSYPFASATSLIEAVLAGLPAVSFQPDRNLEILYFDDEGVAPEVLRTPDEWVERVFELLQSPEARGVIADRQGRQAAVHHGDAWRQRLERCYEAARGAAPGAVPHPTQILTARADALFALHAGAGVTRDVRTLLENHSLMAPSSAATISTAGWMALIRELGIDEPPVFQPQPGPQLEPEPEAALRPWRIVPRSPESRRLALLIEELGFRRVLHIGDSAQQLCDELSAIGIEVTNRMLEGAAARGPRRRAAGLLPWLDDELAGPDRRAIDSSGAFDLALCLGAFQRLAERDLAGVMGRILAASNAILFGADPCWSDEEVLVMPMAEWSRRFARLGMFRAPPSRWPSRDAGYVLFERDVTSSEIIGCYERELAVRAAEAGAVEARLTSDRDAARHQQHLIWFEFERLRAGLGPPEQGSSEEC